MERDRYRKVMPNVVCRGKIGYPNKGKALERMRRQGKHHGFKRAPAEKRKVQAYKCPVCKQWHVGSSTETYMEQFKKRKDKRRERRADRQIKEAWDRYGH